MITQKKLLLCLVGIGLSLTCAAQKEVISKYQSAIGDNALVFNGEIERIYALSIYCQRPYLESEDYFPGEMVYNRNWFGNLMLRLDLYEEQLIALSPETRIGIDLDMRRISEFTIGKRKFVHFKELPGTPPESGYLHLLFDSEQVKILVKHKCFFKQSVLRDNISYSSFDFKDRYYVLHGGEYYSLKKKSLLYKLFPQYKKQLKQFIRENYLDFKNDRENSLNQLAKHLQSLITQTGQ